MGLLTVCIGMGPLGILMVGALANQFGPLLAVDVMAFSGLITVLGAGLLWRRNEYAAEQAPSAVALLERSKVRAPP
jgi:hypothetical protein